MESKCKRDVSIGLARKNKVMGSNFVFVEVKPEFDTKRVKSLSEKPDELAPDRSEIRLLPSMKGGGLCHCTLRPRRVSKAVKHKTIEEIWYFIQGHGQFWRKQGTR